jgi:hypothetical protein
VAKASPHRRSTSEPGGASSTKGEGIVDGPGVGGGAVDGLAELDIPVVQCNGGEPPIDKERFVKARAEDYWTLRERFEQREIDIDQVMTSWRRSSARSNGASILGADQDRIEGRHVQARTAVTG